MIVGEKLVFPRDIPEHGIGAGAVGIVDSGLNVHVLHSKAYFPKDENVFVMVYGKVLCLPVEFFENESGSSFEGSGSAGSEGGAVDSASATHGGGDGSSTVEAGAGITGEHYSVADAVGTLTDLAVNLDIDGFSKAAGDVFSVIEKLKASAA